VSINHTFRYINDVISVSNINIHNYVHFIYPDEIQERGTPESDKSALYLNVLLNIDSSGSLTASLDDKLDEFDFANVNITFLHCNIPPSPAYGVFIS
jgi:hypothetical protein